MPVALITGIIGQDGSYLAELLLGKGYRVVGTTRSVARALSSLPVTLAGQIELIEWDMLSERRMKEIVAAQHPDEIYNFAAYSSGAGMFDDPTGIGDVNGLAVSRILEAIRVVDERIRFCQASSSEMFGEPQEWPQSERTVFRPRSPYGAAKLYAHSMIHIYRQHYGLHACSAILFNHESPRRSIEFVTRKITSTVAKIKLGAATELYLGNLEARRDWGFSGDYVRAMWLMTQAPNAQDYVVATGITHSVRQFCECAFRCVGLDYRRYVHEDVAARRPDEKTQLIGNPEKLQRQLGWATETGFEGLVKMMISADLELFREALQKDA